MGKRTFCKVCLHVVKLLYDRGPRPASVFRKFGYFCPMCKTLTILKK